MKRGDLVRTKIPDGPNPPGRVIRVARDGSWADVRWFTVDIRFYERYALKWGDVPWSARMPADSIEPVPPPLCDDLFAEDT